MSASKAERDHVKAARDEYHDDAARRGHTLRWQLGPNANRAGYAYSWEGECSQCGATLSVSWCSSTSHGPRDARDGQCGGEGTEILTAIEAKHQREQFGHAVSDFGQNVQYMRMVDASTPAMLRATLVEAADAARQGAAAAAERAAELRMSASGLADKPGMRHTADELLHEANSLDRTAESRLGMAAGLDSQAAQISE